MPPSAYMCGSTFPVLSSLWAEKLTFCLASSEPTELRNHISPRVPGSTIWMKQPEFPIALAANALVANGRLRCGSGQDCADGCRYAPINLAISTARYSTPRMASITDSERAGADTAVMPAAPSEVIVAKL